MKKLNQIFVFNRLIKASILGILLMICSGQISAQKLDSVEMGSEKFQHSCEPCHGQGPGDDGRAMLPGTAALQIKYRDALPAALEKRSDLNYDVLRAYVRQGSWSMPPFRKTELTDGEIENIAAYLAESSKAQ